MRPASPLRAGVGEVRPADAQANGQRSHWRPAEHWSLKGTWSRESIVRALKDWAQLTGTPPRIHDWVPGSARALGVYGARCRLWESEHPRWPSGGTVVQHFGTWAEALQAAGLPVTPRHPSGTLAERVQAARSLSAQGLSQREIAELLEVDRTTVCRYMSARVCACGEPVARSTASPPRCVRCTRHRHGPAWDKPGILAAYEAWRVQTGSRPVRADWQPRSERSGKWHHEFPRWPSVAEVRVVFGTWGALVSAQGDQLRPKRTPKWNRQSTLQALRRRGAELGRCPAEADLGAAYGTPALSTITKLFGTLSGALAEVGLYPEGHKRGRAGYTEQELISALRKRAAELGRVPKARELEGSHPGPLAIARRFGSWNRALLVAGVGVSRGSSSHASRAAPAEARHE